MGPGILQIQPSRHCPREHFTDCDHQERTRRADAECPASGRHPACDVYENPDEILVVADLPGVGADALSVNLSGGELTLEGTRQFTAHGGTYLSTEYRDCDFRRRFTVPGGIDASKISAELKNGVMWLRLPKSEALKPRQIAVRAG